MKPRSFSLVILALICGLLVSGLFALTREQIDDNRQRYALIQLHEVIGASDVELRPLGKDRYLIVDARGGEVFKQHSSEGYNGNISLWIAIDDQGGIRGVRVISHRETPGIGDLIDKNVSNWIDQFQGRSLAEPVADDWKLSLHGGVIDHVSGATITTRAVTRAVRQGLVESAQ